MTSPKLIVILGPTSAGKTKMAAKLAAQFNGEIISADSRQVYRGMDIGTGKDINDYVIKVQSSKFKVQAKKIPYHLIDVASPKTEFNVAKYQKMAYQAINDVLSRGKTPFLVGGTGLYLDAVIKGFLFPNKIPDSKFPASPAGRQILNSKKKLNQLTLNQLLVRLKKIDPASYNIIDRKNRRRVERALAIYYETGRPKSVQLKPKKPPYDILILGLTLPRDEIYQKIDARLAERLQQGLIQEVKKLRQGGVSWQRLENFGLEYRYVARYLKGEISYEKMVEELKKAIHHFAKRQLTWFRKNNEIIWLKNPAEAKKKIKIFLGQN